MEFVHPRLGKTVNGQDPLLAESLCFRSSCPICHKKLLWLGERGMRLRVKNKLGQMHLHRRKHPLLTTVCQRLFLARRPWLWMKSATWAHRVEWSTSEHPHTHETYGHTPGPCQRAPDLLPSGPSLLLKPWSLGEAIHKCKCISPDT